MSWRSRFGRHTNVIGDSVFRVLGRIAGDAELIEAPVRKPAANEPLRQPLAPLHLQSHLALHEGGARSRCRQRKREDELNSVEDSSCVSPFEGVEEQAVPAVDADLNEQIGDDQ
jgi:hypothetical protein